jgi:hypothetical protein
LHPGEVAIEPHLPRAPGLLPWRRNQEEGVQHVCDNGCAGDEWDVVGDANDDIRADAADSLGDACEVGNKPPCSDIDYGCIPKKSLRYFPGGFSVNEDRNVMVVRDFLQAIQDGDRV